MSSPYTRAWRAVTGARVVLDAALAVMREARGPTSTQTLAVSEFALLAGSCARELGDALLALWREADAAAGVLSEVEKAREREEKDRA